MAAFPLPNWLTFLQGPRSSGPWCRTALATDASLQGAVDAIVKQLQGRSSGLSGASGHSSGADLALVFASSSYASDLPRLLPLLQAQLKAEHWLGCVGGGVVGTDAAGQPHELEHAPALSVTLLRLPGAELRPFAIDTQTLPDLDGPAQPWQALLGADQAELAAMPSMLLLVDPSCQAINDLISGLDYACPQAAKLGGIAAAHSAPHGSLLFGSGVTTGAVGCLIGGAWRLDPVVAQGCRPIGPVLEVEQAERNVVLEVSEGSKRHSPVAALQAILTGLSPGERELAKNALFLGVGRNSFNLESASQASPGESLGAKAFLVRNLIGVDPRNGAVAVAERMRVGQQVQFQLRDGTTSRQESRQLLQRQGQCQPAPLAALLFACLGRGQGLYGERDGDVSLCRESFAEVPISGAFCNGEIGPIAGTTHLHGYTASWAFLVPHYGAEHPSPPG
jgi:small ligand-binding sensory domain FIST